MVEDAGKVASGLARGATTAVQLRAFLRRLGHLRNIDWDKADKASGGVRDKAHSRGTVVDVVVLPGFEKHRHVAFACKQYSDGLRCPNRVQPLMTLQHLEIEPG